MSLYQQETDRINKGITAKETARPKMPGVAGGFRDTSGDFAAGKFDHLIPGGRVGSKSYNAGVEAQYQKMQAAKPQPTLPAGGHGGGGGTGVQQRQYQHGSVMDDIVGALQIPSLDQAQEDRIARYGGYEPSIPSPQIMPPAGNINALGGIDQSAPPVNLAETATQMPGYVSPTGVKGINAAKAIQQKQKLAAPIPANHIATNNGWMPREEAGLTGNNFNEGNTADYFAKTGYIPDADPRMVQRRTEAESVQAGRLKFIEDSRAGKYGGQNQQAISQGLPADGGWGQAFQRAQGNQTYKSSGVRRNGLPSFEQRHARGNKVADAQLLNAQTNAARMQQTGQLGQQELAQKSNQAMLNRQSAERIAGVNFQQTQAAAKQKQGRADEKYAKEHKNTWSQIILDPNILKAFDMVVADNPASVANFNKSFPGTDYNVVSQLAQENRKNTI